MGSAGSSRVSTALIGIAGVHYAVSELSRRGFIALPTIRNTAGIDVLVTEPNGSGPVVLQVKTSSKETKWWPVSTTNSCLGGSNAYYIFVRYNQKNERFEAFMVKANDVQRQVENYVKDEKAHGNSGMPFWGLPDSEAKQTRLAQEWQDWRP